MRHTLRLALVLALATATLLTPAAYPQSTNTIPETYRYYDDDGWGTMRVQATYNDQYSGARVIRVTIDQNGRTYQGSGSESGGMFTFTLAGYFFEGRLNTWGTFHPNGAPSPQNATWFWIQP